MAQAKQPVKRTYQAVLDWQDESRRAFGTPCTRLNGSDHPHQAWIQRQLKLLHHVARSP